MAAQALYRRWRSQTFEDVVGQEHVTLTLRNALREGRISHAYLFAGPRGTGKTSTARILAKAVNCLAEELTVRPCNKCRICTAITEGHQLDLIEIDAASNRGIDEIRDLREKIGFRPNEARYKVYIIDEVHMLTKEAFNALLKTLEEPPPHAIFVLATTEPDRVPETVRSRCQRHDFRRIPTPEIVEHLKSVLEGEGASAAPEALVAVARRSTGSMRDAISLLDQLLSYGDEALTLARVESVLGIVDAHTIGRLVDFIAAGDAGAGLSLINELVAEGVELGELVDQIVAYLRGVLFISATRAPALLDVPHDIAAAMDGQAGILSVGALLNALREFIGARALLRDQVPGVPQLPIEIAFMRAVLPAGEPVERPSGAVEPSAGASPAEHRPVSPAVPAPNTRTALAEAEHAEPARQPEGSPAENVPGTTARSAPTPVPETEPGDEARANWDRFLAMAGKRCGMKVQAALRSVREIDGTGGALVLYFSHTFSRDLVDQLANRIQVEALWEELLGRKVEVRCTVMGDNTMPRAGVSSRRTPGAESVGDDDVLLHEARRLGAVVKPLD